MPLVRTRSSAAPVHVLLGLVRQRMAAAKRPRLPAHAGVSAGSGDLRDLSDRHTLGLFGPEAFAWPAPAEVAFALGPDAFQSQDTLGRRSHPARSRRRGRMRPRQHPNPVFGLPPQADARAAGSARCGSSESCSRDAVGASLSTFADLPQSICSTRCSTSANYPHPLSGNTASFRRKPAKLHFKHRTGANPRSGETSRGSTLPRLSKGAAAGGATELRLAVGPRWGLPLRGLRFLPWYLRLICTLAVALNAYRNIIDYDYGVRTTLRALQHRTVLQLLQ